MGAIIATDAEIIDEQAARVAELEASNNKLRDALSIALQYVPLGHDDATEIHTLVKEATK